MCFATKAERKEGETIMQVKIRLRKAGKVANKRYNFKVVAIQSTNSRDGRFLENVGTYNPLADPAEISLKQERIRYWLSKGAIPTSTVKSFLKKENLSVNSV